MAKDSPFDMFQSGAKKKDSPPDTNKPLVPTAPNLTRTIAAEAMLARMNRMRQEIEDQIDAIASNHGITKEALNKYLSNPKNFTPEQWQFLQFRSQDLKRQIIKDITPSIPAKGAASSTDRKSKFVGQRRKWIPTS